jgi:hypothetical protein
MRPVPPPMSLASSCAAALAVGLAAQPPRRAPAPAARPDSARRVPPPADSTRWTLQRAAGAPGTWTLRQFTACDPDAAARTPASPVPLCERQPAVP